eukprot:scpid93299/ scgid21332/ 
MFRARRYLSRFTAVPCASSSISAGLGASRSFFRTFIAGAASKRHSATSEAIRNEQQSHALDRRQEAAGQAGAPVKEESGDDSGEPGKDARTARIVFDSLEEVWEVELGQDGKYPTMLTLNVDPTCFPLSDQQLQHAYMHAGASQPTPSSLPPTNMPIPFTFAASSGIIAGHGHMAQTTRSGQYSERQHAQNSEQQNVQHKRRLLQRQADNWPAEQAQGEQALQQQQQQQKRPNNRLVSVSGNPTGASLTSDDYHHSRQPTPQQQPSVAYRLAAARDAATTAKRIKTRNGKRVPLPHSPPYSAEVWGTDGLSPDELMELFKEQEPTRAWKLDASSAVMQFGEKKHLVAALNLSRSETVRGMVVRPSLVAYLISLVDLPPPYVAYMALWSPCPEEHEVKSLMSKAGCYPDRVLIRQRRFCILLFETKAELVKACELHRTEHVRHMNIEPYFGLRHPHA